MNPKSLEFIYKNCVFILPYLNISHLQNTLHLIQYNYQDIFSHGSRAFDLVNFDAF